MLDLKKERTPPTDLEYGDEQMRLLYAPWGKSESILNYTNYSCVMLSGRNFFFWKYKYRGKEVGHCWATNGMDSSRGCFLFFCGGFLGYLASGCSSCVWKFSSLQSLGEWGEPTSH